MPILTKCFFLVPYIPRFLEFKSMGIFRRDTKLMERIIDLEFELDTLKSEVRRLRIQIETMRDFDNHRPDYGPMSW